MNPGLAGVDDGRPVSSDGVGSSRLAGFDADAVLMSLACCEVVGTNGWAVGDNCADFSCLRAIDLRLVGPGLRPGFFFLAIS